jgi:hypothetical protein
MLLPSFRDTAVVFGESSMALAKVFDAESISKTTKTQDIFQLISQITSLIGQKHGLAAFFLRSGTRCLKTTQTHGQ